FGHGESSARNQPIWYVNKLFQEKELSNGWKASFVKTVSLKDQARGDKSLSELPWQHPGQEMVVLIDPEGRVRYQAAWKGAPSRYTEAEKYFDESGKYLKTTSDPKAKSVLKQFSAELNPGPWNPAYFDGAGHLKASLVNEVLSRLPVTEYVGETAIPPAGQLIKNGTITVPERLVEMRNLQSPVNLTIILAFIAGMLGVFIRAAGFGTRVKKFLPKNKFGDRAPVVLLEPRALSDAEMEQAKTAWNTLANDAAAQASIKETIRGYIVDFAEF